VWGYEATNPFAKHYQPFVDAGIGFYVAPGTSAWLTFAGRTQNAIDNLTNAARSGAAGGALGYLNTDWGDDNSLEPLSVSYLGLLLGAGVSWNAAVANAPALIDLPMLLDVHVFRDSAAVMGRAAFDLGNAYLEAESRVPTMSGLYSLVAFPDETVPGEMTEGITFASLQRTLSFVKDTASRLDSARMDRPDAELVLEEFRWVGDMLVFSCQLGMARFEAGNGSPMSAIAEGKRLELAEELSQLAARHRQIWLRRNRFGGLDDSTARLARTEGLLRGNA
jgi:hypothetical protein